MQNKHITFYRGSHNRTSGGGVQVERRLSTRHDAQTKCTWNLATRGFPLQLCSISLPTISYMWEASIPAVQFQTSDKSSYLLRSGWLLHKQKREFSDTNFENGKLWWHFDWMLQSSSGRKASYLKVSIRELSFPFQSTLHTKMAIMQNCCGLMM